MAAGSASTWACSTLSAGPGLGLADCAAAALQGSAAAGRSSQDPGRPNEREKKLELTGKGSKNRTPKPRSPPAHLPTCSSSSSSSFSDLHQTAPSSALFFSLLPNTTTTLLNQFSLLSSRPSLVNRSWDVSSRFGSTGTPKSGQFFFLISLAPRRAPKVPDSLVDPREKASYFLPVPRHNLPKDTPRCSVQYSEGKSFTRKPPSDMPFPPPRAWQDGTPPTHRTPSSRCPPCRPP